MFAHVDDSVRVRELPPLLVDVLLTKSVVVISIFCNCCLLRVRVPVGGSHGLWASVPAACASCYPCLLSF